MHRAWMGGCFWLLMAGCSVHVDAPTVRPPVVPRGPLSATVAIDVSGVPEDSLCSTARDHSGVKSLCIDGLRPAMGDGLAHVMSRYMQPVDGPSSEYRAVLAVTRLYHWEAADPVHTRPMAPDEGVWASRVSFGLVWQFTLRRTSDGMPVAQGSERVELRDPIDDTSDADDAVDELLTRSLVRISELVQDASMWSAPPHRTGR